MSVQTPPQTASALYCYGVMSSDSERALPGPGLEGAAVEPVVHRKLAALVSAVPAGTVRARRRDLLTHFDVLASAFDRGTVLPLRFGIVFDDERSLVDELLEPSHDELVRQLKDLRDRAEVRVTAHYREDAILAEAVRANPRIARLREFTRDGGAAGHPALIELGELVSAEVQARTARDSRALLERLRPLAEREEVDREPIEFQLLRASFLVQRKKLEKLESALEAFAGDNAGRVDVKLVGPLPPHSFVALSPRGRG